MGEMIVFAAGMAGAFFLGAYVRLPFAGRTTGEKEKAEAGYSAGEEVEEGRLTVEKQLENMMNYNGSKQE